MTAVLASAGIASEKTGTGHQQSFCSDSGDIKTPFVEELNKKCYIMFLYIHDSVPAWTRKR